MDEFTQTQGSNDSSDLQSAAIRSAVFQRRLRHAADMLRRHVVARTPDVAVKRVLPEDILQEVWVAAFKSEELLQGIGDEELERWLKRVANRRLVDALRHHLNQKRGANREALAPDLTTSLIGLFETVASPQKTPSSVAARNEIAREVQSAIESLPEITRRVIWMHHIDGLDRDEIARRIDKTPDAVRGILYRGMTQLSHILKRHDKGSSST